MVLLDPQTWLTSQDPLRVVALRDPAVEAVGHEPRSRLTGLGSVPSEVLDRWDRRSWFDP